MRRWEEPEVSPGENISEYFVQAELELQLRINKEMTVADIIRIGY